MIFRFFFVTLQPQNAEQELIKLIKNERSTLELFPTSISSFFMANIIEYAKVAKIYAKGILGLRKKEYRLSFVYVPEDRLWYIDMPWPGDRYNLAMVAGSDKMLDRLCEEEDDNYVTVDVRPRRKREVHAGFYECVQTKSSLLGGSYYEVHGLEGFNRTIWICPVTLCVLGHYPKYIYVRKVDKSTAE